MIYWHKTSRTVPTCHTSVGSLKLPAPEAGDLVELILLYKNVRTQNKGLMACTAVNVLATACKCHMKERNAFSKHGVSKNDSEQLM